MVGDNEQALLAQAQPLALLRRRHHLPRLSCPYHMGQQGIPAVEDVCNCVHLMGFQGDLRVHAHKIQVAPVILAGPGAVELYIIELCQLLPALGVFPYPVLERLLDKLLLALGDGGLLLVQNGLFLPVLVLNIVKNPNIPLVQGFLNDLIGVDAPGSVGVGRLDTVFILGFPLDIPRPGDLEWCTLIFHCA